MENASKALIIAGAILISILIIGLGVFIFSNSADTVSNANLNSEKAQAHNGKFTNYFGNNVSASQVKALMKEVVTNNATADTANELAYVYVLWREKASDTDIRKTTTEITELVKSGFTYSVNAMDDSASEKDDTAHDKKNADAGYYKSGYIKTIRIIQNAKGSGV